MNNTISIREATFNDIPQIAKVHVDSWITTYKGLLPDAYLSTLTVESRVESWKKLMEANYPKSKIFVAVDGDRICGFTNGGKYRDVGGTVTPPQIGELYSIYLLADYQGKGIGSNLMTATINHLKSQNFVMAYLWVLNTNQKAKNWYMSKNWAPEGSRMIVRKPGFTMIEERYKIDLNQG